MKIYIFLISLTSFIFTLVVSKILKLFLDASINTVVLYEVQKVNNIFIAVSLIITIIFGILIFIEAGISYIKDEYFNKNKNF